MVHQALVSRPGGEGCPPSIDSTSHSPAFSTYADRRQTALSLAADGDGAARTRTCRLGKRVGCQPPRVRISNPQLAVTQVRAPPGVMLEGCPNNAQDLAMPNTCRKERQGLPAASVFAAQLPIRRGLPGCLQDGCSAC